MNSWGFGQQRTRSARTASGTAEFAIYDAVRLMVEGHDCVVEVAQLPDECPVLIGQLALEALDFVVDPMGQRLLGNPDHGGMQLIDVFRRSGCSSVARTDCIAPS